MRHFITTGWNLALSISNVRMVRSKNLSPLITRAWALSTCAGQLQNARKYCHRGAESSEFCVDNLAWCSLLIVVVFVAVKQNKKKIWVLLFSL